MKYATTKIGVPYKKIKKIRPLPDNLGSWCSEYNLIQIWIVDEIYKNNNWGAIKKIKLKWQSSQKEIVFWPHPQITKNISMN
jgi:hypothetical protein